MPVARIITLDPASASAAEQQLQELGYEVEIVTPREAITTIADVEITLQTCSANEAERRAGKLARQHDAAVFVAPGVVGARGGESLVSALISDMATRLRAALAGFGRKPRNLEVLTLSRPDEEPQLPPGPAMPAVEAVPDPVVKRAPEVVEAAPAPTEMAAPVSGSSGREAIANAVQRGGAALAFVATAPQQLTAWKRSRREKRAEVKSPRSLPPRRRSLRARDWKIAATLASAITIVVMLVWAALANRRPASPLPLSAVDAANVQQQRPFGPVTVLARPTPPSSSGHELVTTRKPSALRAKPGSRAAKRPARRAVDEDDEVVVRHFTPSRTPAPPRSGVKRFSDLD
jgi:hypothetical protein